ncbi:uncharacterized protein CEXT_223251 [Caerostris extrusa]|uniref:Uncharacterized protein n=1 Tax=Caerostris extrusa TaxID=172846 RepID=A0AAV4TLB4_CAEEX|nr:uncharacterized protein CEXT_223251 [Caerostris extrusa]
MEIASAGPYLGINRLRKLPGGDTNDIFDLEYHQRLQASKVQKSNEDKSPNADSIPHIYLYPSKDMAKISIKNFHKYAKYPLNQFESDTEFSESSFHHLDEENINVLSDKMDSFKVIDQLIEDNLNVQEEDKEEELKKSSTKKYLCRNPVTGKVYETEVSMRSKLADCSDSRPKCAE